MTIASNGDIDLYYERAGSGPNLLFIGGTGGDLRSKPNVFDGPFAKQFDLVAYDQRGLGRSSKPDRAYTMADYGDDAAALIGAVGWGSCAVVGVSFGGMVAQELALRHPSLVSRLVLACTSSGGPGGASFPFHELDPALDWQQRARTLMAVNDTRRDEAWQAEHPDEVERLLAMGAPVVEPDAVAAMGARRQLEARAGHDTWDRLPSMAVATLVAGGRFDGIAPPANQEALAGRIPNSTLRFFEGGHLFLIQDRAAFPAIVDFLSARN